MSGPTQQPGPARGYQQGVAGTAPREAPHLRALIWLLCAVMAAFISITPWSRGIDAGLHDAITSRLEPAPVPSGVVVLEIDERSLATLGPWPWPRPLLARISQALRDHGARVQVWDVMLPQDSTAGDELAVQLSRADVVLGQALVTDPQVLTPPVEGRRSGLQAPPAGLCSTHAPITGHIAPGLGLNAGTVGHINASPDADGRLRSLPAVLCQDGEAYPQLALATALAAAPAAAWELERGLWPWQAPITLTRGAWRFPMEEGGLLRVPFSRPHTAWPVLKVEQLLDPAAELPALRGAVVMVGATALGLGDIVSTPYHPAAPGVSIHAEIVAAAMPGGTGLWLVRPPLEAFWAILLLAPGLLLVRRLEPQLGGRRALQITLCVVILTPLTAVAVRVAGMVLGGVHTVPMLPLWPVILALLAQTLATWMLNAALLRRESRRLARHLESFMPAALARLIVQNNPSGESLGEPQHGTLLALRVSGIERWVSSVEPLQALGLIHVINASVQNLASGLGGRLEHMQGHTLLLAWPTSDLQAVRRAIEVARRCTAELGPLLRQNESETYPLGMNIAIESGAYLQGIVGSAETRRAVLLGTAATDVLSMLELSDDLASPILLGPMAAAHHARSPELQRLGQFVLPQQVQPKPLFRYGAPLAPGLTEAA